MQGLATTPAPCPASRSSGPRASKADLEQHLAARALCTAHGRDGLLPAGQRVTMGDKGSRPQDAELAHDADPQAIIKLPVKLREELGSEVQVHGAIGTAAHTSGGEAEDLRSLATIVARVNPRTAIKEGDAAKVLIDTGALHFFDRASGDSIRG